jgi:hypothetical protein
MEVRTARDGQPLADTKTVVDQIKQTLDQYSQTAQRKLAEHPEEFRDFEKEVHNEFGRLADLFVAGVLGAATQGDGFTENARKK